MAKWGRAHAIKAALVVGFLLLLLNLFGPRLDVKYDKTTSFNVMQQTGSLQWPKRTRSSSSIITNHSQSMSIITNNTTSNNHNYNNNNNKNGTISTNVTSSNNITSNVILPTAIIKNVINLQTTTPTIPSSKVTIQNSNDSIIKLAHNATHNNKNIKSKISLVNKLNEIIIKNNKTIISLNNSNINSSNSSNIINNNNNNNKTENNNYNNLIIDEQNQYEGITKSHFLQTLMTTLGLNTCPPIPPNLDGPFDINTSYDETLIQVEKRLGPKLQPGGMFKPKECNARDKVAIIVPYRDRASHLPVFLKNIHPFLMKQQIEYGIFIVEQTSGSLFNRAALMNIGFVEALKIADWDCFVFHDVDLLPLDDRNLYTCPDQPRHMSVAVDTLSFKLPYSTLFGGVSAMTVKQFKTVNGFSNSFWGWGGEDDDMSNRLKHVGFHIARYPINIARYTMLTHKKEKANPKRYEQLVNGAKRIDVDGLNSLKYKLHNVIKKPLYTWIFAEINQEQTS